MLSKMSSQGRRTPLSLNSAAGSNGTSSSQSSSIGNLKPQQIQHPSKQNISNKQVNSTSNGANVKHDKNIEPQTIDNQREQKHASVSNQKDKDRQKHQEQSDNSKKSLKENNVEIDKSQQTNGGSNTRNNKEKQIKEKEKDVEKKSEAKELRARKKEILDEKRDEKINVVVTQNVDKMEDKVSAPGNIPKNIEPSTEKTPVTPKKSTSEQKDSSKSPRSQKYQQEKKIDIPLTAEAHVVAKKVAVAENMTTISEIIIIPDDIEMEPTIVKSSPIKNKISEGNINPTATSTPGKIFENKQGIQATKKSEVQPAIAVEGGSPDRQNCPRTFSQISGRRSIRQIGDYSPCHQFKNNLPMRESYRRITTDLDLSSISNSSLNVTVGSEIPNNSSFSFFGRGRKRDRTPPNCQSAIELTTDVETSPPKRARLEFPKFFSMVSSPMSILRSRFSKASIKSANTPVKLHSKLANEDITEVQNVSGISIEDEIINGNNEVIEKTNTENIDVGVEAGSEIEDNENKNEDVKIDKENVSGVDISTNAEEGINENGSSLPATNKFCKIM